MSIGEETIEHLGRVSTFVWDLEARWQAESAQRRLDASEGDVILDIDAALPTEPSVVWAHLTTPSLRSRWEGPLVVEESTVGGHRGVGTITQCVTGRLATIEEVVDWQPYEHIGWRVTVPDVGPVGATVDLDPVEGGTRVHLRWSIERAGARRGRRLRRDRSREAGGTGAARKDARRAVGHDRSTGGTDMIHYSSEVTIARPPHAVYEALLDPGLYPKWTDMVDVSFDGADTPRVGTRGRFRLAKGPIKGTLEMEVTELDPDRRVVFRVTHPSARLDGGLDARSRRERDSPDLCRRAPDARLATAARAAGRSGGAQR